MSLLKSALSICIYSLLFQNHFRVSNARTVRARITGGDVAKDGQFPFMAALDIVRSNSKIFCGGSLLSTQWILTSALCLIDVQNITVRLGSSNLAASDSVTASSAQFIIHPKFDPETVQNDVALIQLEEPVELSPKIQTIRLGSINLPNILIPTAVGWGQTSNDDDDSATDLHFVSLKVLSNKECQQIYGDYVTDSILCVNGNGDEGTCYGDNGSPLVVRPIGAPDLQQFAISSFISAEGCGNNQPSGYTRTYPYLDWIRNTTRL